MHPPPPPPRTRSPWIHPWYSDVSILFLGSTHSTGDPGSLGMWVSGFPWTTLSKWVRFLCECVTYINNNTVLTLKRNFKFLCNHVLSWHHVLTASIMSWLSILYIYRIFCPEDGHNSPVSLWTIMSKVRLEAFMWVSTVSRYGQMI